MKCIYVYQVTDPELGFHVCEPEEMREIIDNFEEHFGIGWAWRYDEL